MNKTILKSKNILKAKLSVSIHIFKAILQSYITSEYSRKTLLLIYLQILKLSYSFDKQHRVQYFISMQIASNCEVEKYVPSKMSFRQLLTKIERATILRWVGTGASGKFSFFCSFLKLKHYCYYFLHLIRVTQKGINKTKQ